MDKRIHTALTNKYSQVADCLVIDLLNASGIANKKLDEYDMYGSCVIENNNVKLDILFYQSTTYRIDVYVDNIKVARHTRQFRFETEELILPKLVEAIDAMGDYVISEIERIIDAMLEEQKRRDAQNLKDKQNQVDFLKVKYGN